MARDPLAGPFGTSIESTAASTQNVLSALLKSSITNVHHGCAFALCPVANLRVHQPTADAPRVKAPYYAEQYHVGASLTTFRSNLKRSFDPPAQMCSE